jgi:hypothetical protein
MPQWPGGNHAGLTCSLFIASLGCGRAGRVHLSGQRRPVDHRRRLNRLRGNEPTAVRGQLRAGQCPVCVDGREARAGNPCGFLAGTLPDKVSALKFTTREGGEQHVFDVPAEAGNREWHVVSNAGPLPREFLRLDSDLNKQLFNVDVEVPDSAARTVLSLEDVKKVLSHLHVCVQNLEKAGKF